MRRIAIIVLIGILIIGAIALFLGYGKKKTQPKNAVAPIVPQLKISDRTDTDKDGLTDWYEINVYRTDPKRADTDGDGKNDGEEIRAGVSPTSKENQRLP